MIEYRAWYNKLSRLKFLFSAIAKKKFKSKNQYKRKTFSFPNNYSAKIIWFNTHYFNTNNFEDTFDKAYGELELNFLFKILF